MSRQNFVEVFWSVLINQRSDIQVMVQKLQIRIRVTGCTQIVKTYRMFLRVREQSREN